MDGNAPRRGGWPGRTLAIAAGIVILVGVVAVASTGSVPSGSGGGGGRRPSDTFLDTALSLLLVLMAVCAVFAAVALTFFRRYDPVTAAPKPVSPLRSVVSFLIAMALLAILVRAIVESRREGAAPLLPGLGEDGAGPGDTGEAGRYDPEFALWPVVVVVTLLAVGAVGWWLSTRGRKSAAEPLAPTPAEALADVLADTLDDLRSERDPRRAVIGAYARMERALAAAGLPRRDSEAPSEYVERVLAEVPLTSRAANRLTALFAWARFSVHDVRPEMKEEAIETLERVQAELAAAETTREIELAGLLR